MPQQHSNVLAGRAALVTGGNRGLGREIARAFVSAGASVMVCARDAGTLAHAAGEMSDLAKNGQLVLWQQCDVTDVQQVSNVVERSVQELGSLQILVSNAGVYGPFGAIEGVDWADWVRAVEINLYGSVCRSAVCCRTLRVGVTARLSSSRAAARPIRCRG